MTRTRVNLRRPLVAQSIPMADGWRFMTTADSAIESSVEWVVCPRIDISDLNQRPEYFPSKEEAELCLDFPMFGPPCGVDGRRHYTTSGREMGSVALPVVGRTKVPRGPAT